MITVITVGGEFGSGRGEIAGRLAARLGWRLLDNALIEEIARTAQVDPDLAVRYDERIDPWFHRLQKALWRGGYEGAATTTQADLFDADTMAAVARRILEAAANHGQCVIVGRGGQCVLQERRDAFHVFVYAPLEQRIERVRRRVAPEVDAEALIDATDRMRHAYVRRYFGHEWANRHIYDMMVCSSMGLEAAVAAILAAVENHEPL